MNNYDDKRMDSVSMSQKKAVSILNDLIFHSIAYGVDAGGPYKSNKDTLIASLNNALQYFGLSDYEVGEVIRDCDHGRGCYPGLIEIIPFDFEKQSQDDVTIFKEDKTMEWDDDDLEELMAEALEAAKCEGCEPEPPEPVKRGDLIDILASLQDEDDDEEDPNEGSDSAQLAKSIEWLLKKNMSAKDIADFVKYVYE